MQVKKFDQPKTTNRRVIWMAAASVVAAVIAGCTVGPDYVPPKVTTPGLYSSAATTRLATTQASSAVGASTQKAETGSAPVLADLSRWWEAFNDPVLNGLVERAVVGNLDVKVAESRLRQARAQLGISAAAWYPSVDANSSVTRSRSSVTGFQRTIPGTTGGTGGTGGTGTGTGTGTTIRGGQIGGDESTLWRSGFDATWEIDVFGGVRRDVEAARADLAAQEEDRRNVLTSVLAEVASNYVTVRGTQQQIRIARQNIASQRRTLEVNEARANAGVLSDYDVSTARGQVANFEAQIPPLETQEAAAVFRIGVLLGLAPGTLRSELAPTETIPMSLPVIPVGLPSELLRRRPDIRGAERRIAAQTARIGVATSDLFPKFSLTGSLGTQNSKFAHLGDASSLFYSIGPAVSWNVFDAGRIRNNIRVQNELQNQTISTYNQTILLAMEDVENAITSYSRNVERREALRRAVDAQRRAVENVTNLFSGGLGDPLNILIAQRDEFNYELQLVQTETELSANLVSLYKALGGGWETFREGPPPKPDSQTTK